MTAQEAIEILRDTPIDIRSTREDDIYTLYAMAQNIAIEALSNNKNPSVSELKTTTGDVSEADVIYRQDAIDALSLMQGIVAEYGVRKGISMAWQQIKDLPSAQSEIIRCKDCVHNFEGLFRCDRVTFYNEKDDFCSKAKMKRRSEENETD